MINQSLRLKSLLESNIAKMSPNFSQSWYRYEQSYDDE